MRYAIPDNYLIEVIDTKCSLDFIVDIDTEPQWAQYSVPFLADMNDEQSRFIDQLMADFELRSKEIRG